MDSGDGGRSGPGVPVRWPTLQNCGAARPARPPAQAPASSAILSAVKPVHPTRHLVRARDLADRRYADQIDVAAMAAAAGLSKAHFSREFRKVFGETPHQYLLSRRLERAAALLRSTDHTVAEICLEVGLQSIGSFTTSFARSFGTSPTTYRASHPPASNLARIPPCAVRIRERPMRPPAVPAQIPPSAGTPPRSEPGD